MIPTNRISENVLLVGYGYWGTNLARAIQNTPGLNLSVILDENIERRKRAGDLYQSLIYPSISEWRAKENPVNFGVIATRPGSHLDLTLELLEMGLTVLLTKPAGSSLLDCKKIQQASKSFGINVFVDFTYLYSTPIEMLEEWRVNYELGEWVGFVSYRTSLGIVQSDVDVLADLLSHDLSILISKLGSSPDSVECLRIDNFDSDKAHNAAVKLTWENGFIAFIHVSWLSPVKGRYMQFNFENGSILIQEQNQSEPVSIIMHDMFKKKHSSYEERYLQNISFAVGSQLKPRIIMKEPLISQLEKLVLYSENPNSKPIGTINLATNVWRVIEATRESLLRSCKVDLPQD